MKQCPNCKIEGKIYYRLPDLDILKCGGCGFVYVDEKLSPEEIKNLYAGDFYEKYLFKVDDIELLTARTLKKDFDYIAGACHGMPLPDGGPSTSLRVNKILDFGCAKGDFLSLLGAGWNCCGIDISEEEINEGRRKYGLNLINNTIEKAGFPENYFDAVTMWDVIEHLKEPEFVLGELKKILKPGGIIAIKTPNEDSLLTDIFKFIHKINKKRGEKLLKKIYNYSHINSFSPASLSFWLENNGFEILKAKNRERYITLYCMDKFNPIMRILVKLYVVTARLLKKEAAFVIYARKK